MKTHLAINKKVEWSDNTIKIAACRRGMSVGLIKLGAKEFLAAHKKEKNNICSHCRREYNKIVARKKARIEKQNLK